MNAIKAHKWTIALALLGIAVLANVFTTNRPLAFYKMVQVTEVVTVPDVPELADIRRNAEIGSGFLPHMGIVCCHARDVTAQPVRLGWVYEERGFLGMPYMAHNMSSGPTLYVDNGAGYQIAGISREQLARLEQAVGRPVASEYRFAWYWLVWGVLFPPALALLTWLWLRDRRRREEAAWAAEVAVESPAA